MTGVYLVTKPEFYQKVIRLTVSGDKSYLHLEIIFLTEYWRNNRHLNLRCGLFDAFPGGGYGWI